MPVLEFVPYLSVKDANSAVQFYSTVFDTKPKILLKMPNGAVMHCEYCIGAARFFVTEELPEHGGSPSPKTLSGTTVAIHIYVSDCDQMTATMEANGAEVLMPPEDVFWGERFARLRDPFGHEWGVTTRLRNMSEEEIMLEAKKLFSKTED